MQGLISKYPLDLTGRNPTNLVAGERKLLLNRGNTPFRVVSFDNGGFYANTLTVFDRNGKRLIRGQDYIATYKHVDISDYTGLEVLSAIVILNHSLEQSVTIGAQLVGSDLAFSLDAEEETIAYLEKLPANEVPKWGGLIGDYPQWQPGELQEERWERHHYGYLNESIERIVATLVGGDGEVEDQVRRQIREKYLHFIGSIVTNTLKHINDTNKPHAITKNLVGLGSVANYGVASVEVAIQGTRNDVYLTPMTVLEMAKVFGTNPLEQHINHLYTAHSPTAAQIGVYTRDEFDQMASGKLTTNGTAKDANGVQGWYQSTPNVTIRFSDSSLYTELRSNLKTSYFTKGVLAPTLLGRGNPTSRHYLAANGEWRSFDDLFNSLAKGDSTDIHYAGDIPNPNQALQQIRVTYANIRTYPVGTVVVFRSRYNDEYLNRENGDTPSQWIQYWSNQVAIRGPSDWFILT